MGLRNDGIFFKLTGFIKLVKLKIYTDVIGSIYVTSFSKNWFDFHGKVIFFSNALCSRNFQNVKLRLDFVEI